MSGLFRAAPDEPDDADRLDDEEGRPEAEPPSFALIVSEVANDGWHMSAVIGESRNLDFYARALTVRWPFIIARPVRSNRSSDKIIDPKDLSPGGSSPARKLVVNWAWEPVEENVAQLRFYAKRVGPTWFGTSSRLTVRITLKESAWPRRRVVTKVRSNPIEWTHAAESETDC